MKKIMFWLLISFFAAFCLWVQPVAAVTKTKTEPVSRGVLVCFSGGQEIVRKDIIEGPFADEYKFAHEVKVIDERGEHRLNFSGGLCIIDEGSVSVKNQLTLSDELICYSGATQIVAFDVYDRETTIDEYLEGRTFLAKARGNFLNSDSIHRYLVFGGGACLGNETN